MIADKTRIYDEWVSMAGGQDAGRDPRLIEKDTSAALENIVCRGGNAVTRPGIVKLTETFENNLYYTAAGDFGLQDLIPPPPGEEGSRAGSDAFRYDVFQGAQYYSAAYAECFMVSIGGRIFQIIPRAATYEITEIPMARRNRNNIDLAYMIQADRFMIIQDGESRPIIIDSNVARRSNFDEVPVATIMAYGQGRIVAVVDRDIYFGDIYNGKGNGGDDVLGFTESTFLNEGFPSAIPPTMGPPTAAAFYPQQDTAMGQGELLVFGETGAESFYLSIPRETWKDSAFQRESLLSIGARGHRDLTNVNGDLWFRAQDGRRSFRQARAEVNQWTQIPLSTPVKNYVEAETQWLLKYGSSIHFDNRLICTATPIPNQGRLYHDGLVSLDFDILSSFGRNRDPSWDGHWSITQPSVGSQPKVLQVIKGTFSGQERAFAFCLDENNRNSLFEITRNEQADSSGDIPWSIVGRKMDFDRRLEKKELYGGDMWVDEVRGSVSISVDYRANSRKNWTPWHTFDPMTQIGEAGALVGGAPSAEEGEFPRRLLPKPSDECNEVTKDFLRLGFTLQPRVSGTGHCRVKEFRMHAKIILEKSRGDCQ